MNDFSLDSKEIFGFTVIILSFLTREFLLTCYLCCSRPCAPDELRGVADTADEDDHEHGAGAAGDTSGGGHSPGDKGAEAAGVPSLS